MANRKKGSASTRDVKIAQKISSDCTLSTKRRPQSVAALIRAAKKRGADLAQEILARDGMLTGAQAEDRSGVPRRTLNARRAAGTLLGLIGPAQTRGYRYPSWQFDPEIAKAVTQVCAVLKSKPPWGVYLFFITPQPALGGLTPVDALRVGKSETVFLLAQSESDGQQRAT